MSNVNAGDASAACSAFLEFKGAVKASVIGIAGKALSIIIAALVVFAGLRHSTLVPPPARGAAPVAVTSAPTWCPR
jgi:hypothetical protein